MNTTRLDEEKGNIQYMFDLLKSGEENIKLPNYNNVVLVLGNTGAGKSTLTQFLTGDSDDLEAVETTEDSGDFIILDKANKVSTSTIISKTLFPDLFISAKTNAYFYDCPGFSDTRNAAHDIASTYFTKKVIDSSKAVKLVFVVNHSSVRKGVDRKDFMLLLKHITTLLKNINKFKNSIALIVSKVENRYIRKNGGVHLVSDEKEIATIADFLKIIKQDIITQTTLKMNNDKDFSSNVLNLIDTLLETNKGSYTKIGIFRRPDQEGPLSLSEAMQDGKESLEKIIYDNINYVEKNSKDFGFTISPESKNSVHELADEINKSLSSEIINIGEQIIKYSTREEDTSTDIALLNNRFKVGQDIFSKYATYSSEHSKTFIKQVLKDIRHLDAKVTAESLQKILHFDDYLIFLEIVSGKLLKNSLQWATGFSRVTLYYANSKKWYGFLINLDEWLSEYIIQKNRFYFEVNKLLQQCRVAHGIETTTDKIDIKKLLDQIKYYKTGTVIDNVFNGVQNLTLNYAKLGNLNRVLDFNLNQRTSMECLEPNKLVVKGSFVTLSDIPLTMCPQKLKFLEIFISNKIFIDSNIDLIGSKLQMTIIAPTWEIIGNKNINLRGKEGEFQRKAANGYGFSTDGEDGLPGKAGGPGGNFFGIVNKVVGGNLMISVDGGNGGAGQEGGDGSKGAKGKDPYPARSRVTRSVFNEWYPNHDWEEDGFEWEYNGYWERVFVGWYYYKAKGTSALPGGNGGDGGVGGLGGNPGSLIMVDLSDSGKLSGTESPGSRGQDGRGGRAGLGSPNGRFVLAKCKTDRYIFVSVTYCDHDGYLDNGRSADGRAGNSGTVNFGREYPENKVPFIDPALSLNRYKYFLRESLAHFLKPSYLIDFMSKIDSRNEATKLYDTLALVNELEGLENQYSTLSSNIGISPFYQSLLNRINNYSLKPKENEKSSKYKKVLAHLYTATLSKMSSLNSQHYNAFVVDVPIFLDVVIQNIKKLKVIQNKVAINEVMLDYRKGIESQIKNAQDIIKMHIIPEINSIFNNSDYQIECLVNDTIKMIMIGNQEKFELRKKQEKLERSLLLKLMLGPINMISEYLNLGSPFMEEMTKNVMHGFNSVAEHLSLNDNLNIPNSISYLSSISHIIGPSFGKMNNIFLDNQELFNSQLDEIDNYFKNYIKENTNDNNINDIHNKIKEAKTYMKNDIPENELIDPSAMNDLRRTLLKELESKQTFLDKQNQTNKTGEELRIINQSQNILDLNKISAELYLSIKNDEDKLTYIGDTIKGLNEKIKILENFEMNIYRIIVPSFRQLKKIIDMAESKVGNSTYAELEIKRLGLKNVINGIKVEIRHLIRKINVEEELTSCLEKIDETLSIIFNIHTRLDDFYDKAKLAAYIADISSPKALGIKLSDQRLETALNTLQLSIKSNLLLEQYNKVMEAFTQLVFPFANLYLAQFNLPESFNLHKSLDDLTFIATQKLEQLKSKLLESSISIGKYDDYKYSNFKFNSEHQHSTPFFVWKNELNRGAIVKLLDGFEVNLKADIMNGVKQDAVKFNVIGLRFKINGNETLQHELNKKIENYEVVMQHHGYSYYQCGNEFYVITSEKQTFSFHMKKDNNGDPIKRNTVFDKIKNNEPLLSPYTMWTIRLVHQFEDFKKLSKFKKEDIDLELIGLGQYIQKGKVDIEICNKDLQKYYQVDESISELNTIYKLVEEGAGNNTSELDNSIATSRRKRHLEDYSMTSVYPAAVSGASVSKPSPINTMVNAILTAISLLNCIRPFDKIKQWIAKNEYNYLHEENKFISSYQMIDQNIFAEKGFVSSNKIPEPSLHKSEFVDSSILKTTNNILLWNVLLKKLIKTEMKQCKPFPIRNERDEDYSHFLAYNYYANKHLSPLEKPENLNHQCNSNENTDFSACEYAVDSMEHQAQQSIYSIGETSINVPLLQ